MKNKLWLIGAGPMAVDYVKVLNALNVEYEVIGRGERSAQECTGEAGVPVICGGVEAYLCGDPELPELAIVAVGVEELANVTKSILRNGIKKILLEKPGGINGDEIYSVLKEARKCHADVYIAYNRRFYSSVRKAREIIRDDGGVTSFNFEFTEWSHQIVDIEKAPGIKENWLLANSSHVIDLAFFLGGKPKTMSCYKTGGLEWHPSGSIYAGAGISESGALFSYQANWEAPGRWGVEILTRKHRLIFRPLEKLHIQNIGSVAIQEVPLDEDFDSRFKPGLYLQVRAFLNEDDPDLISISDHFLNVEQYQMIRNG
ncbi:MAG: Gfo/Idh/MocA family oxidoreductase [Syntrophorhabdaceae bacterium]